MSLKELEGKIGEKRKALTAVLAEAKTGSGRDLRYDHTKVKSQEFSTGTDLVEWVDGAEKALAELETEANGIRKMSAIEDRNRRAQDAGVNSPSFPADNGNEGRDERPKTLGDLVVEKFYDESGKRRMDVAKDYDYNLNTKDAGGIQQVLKTDMTRAAGWEPENLRIGRVQLSAQRPIAVADAFPVIPITGDAVRYMLETTFTNNAVETGENAAVSGAIPENALALTETTVNIQKIAASLPVTQEQLDDVDQVRAYIDQRMRYALMARLDSQLLVGNGTPPNVEGLHSVSNIQSTALSGDVLSTIAASITAIRANGFDEPDTVILHPTDWGDVWTLQTADGAFVWNHPAQQGPLTVWGKQLIVTAAESVNQGAVGAFAAQSALYMRQGIQVSLTDSHASEFLDDVLRFKFTMRMAPVFFRPASFGEVTGI